MLYNYIMNEKLKINKNNLFGDIDKRLKTALKSKYDKTKILKSSKIIKNNITLSHLKIPDPYNPSLSIYNNIFEGEFKNIGKINNKWNIIRKYIDNETKKKLTCCYMIGDYDKKNQNINNLMREELINLKIHYILSEKNINENFNGSFIPIMFFDIKRHELEKFSSKLNLDINKLNNNDCYVFIIENFYNFSTLKNYLKNNHKTMNYNDWKNIIFQILYNLYKLNEYILDFTHNNLNLDSIRLYERKEPKNEKYIINNETYSFNDVKITIKFTDFEYANGSEDFIKNENTNKAYNENMLYDIFNIFFIIKYFIKKNNITIDSKLIEFFDNIIGKKNENLSWEEYNESKNKFIYKPDFNESYYNLIKKSKLFNDNLLNGDSESLDKELKSNLDEHNFGSYRIVSNTETEIKDSEDNNSLTDDENISRQIGILKDEINDVIDEDYLTIESELDSKNYKSNIVRTSDKKNKKQDKIMDSLLDRHVKNIKEEKQEELSINKVKSKKRSKEIEKKEDKKIELIKNKKRNKKEKQENEEEGIKKKRGKKNEKEVIEETPLSEDNIDLDDNEDMNSYLLGGPLEKKITNSEIYERIKKLPDNYIAPTPPSFKENLVNPVNPINSKMGEFLLGGYTNPYNPNNIPVNMPNNIPNMPNNIPNMPINMSNNLIPYNGMMPNNIHNIPIPNLYNQPQLLNPQNNYIDNFNNKLNYNMQNNYNNDLMVPMYNQQSFSGGGNKKCDGCDVPVNMKKSKYAFYNDKKGFFFLKK